MASVKQLAGQTLWYGVSSIAARFINYLLTPYLTYKFAAGSFGEINLLYSAIPLITVFFTYGMETAYFRFYNQREDKDAVYNTSSISLIVSTVLITAVMLLITGPFSKSLQLEAHPEYVTIAMLIVAFDTLCVVPFARLRQEGRPGKYAIVRIGGILINVAAVYFFISVCPALAEKDPDGFIAFIYKPGWGVGYVFIANLLQSFFTLLFLSKEFLGFKWKFDKKLWREMIAYCMPLIIVGLGGIVNETFDRIMLLWWAPDWAGPAKDQVGVYAACYKLSILISLGVQAFRMGAEPFFFKQAADGNAAKIYARVMKFFVITLCIMFLLVMLFMGIWKQFIQNKSMWEGLRVVPILLLANIFLGIYYNLSIWYKLGNRTMAGAWITITGAVITLLVNIIFIPRFSYMACAWATFLCYGSMMVISYVWGQKSYPVPYAWKKLSAYLIIAVLVYALHNFVSGLLGNIWLSHGLGVLLLLAYTAFILQIEKKEFQKLPVIGRYLK